MEKYFPALRNLVANYSSYWNPQSVKTYEIVKIVKWSEHPSQDSLIGSILAWYRVQIQARARIFQ